MGKYYGKIGFAKTEETSPGIWEQIETTRNYYGDTIKRGLSWQTSEGVNDDLSISSSISIIADKFAYENLSAMKYAEIQGVKWKISSVNIERPRLILTLGGIYNGNT